MADGEVSKIPSEEVKIEILNTTHNLNAFSSYEQDLADFLQHDALENQKQLLSVTFLWFYKGTLVSYVTLLNDRINLQGNLKTIFRKKGVHYHSLPALKIGRLCVDDHFLRRGLGTRMVDFSITTAHHLSQKYSGCRFLIVDAKRNKTILPDSINFYKKLGFKELKDRKIGITPMYLDLIHDIKLGA